MTSKVKFPASVRVTNTTTLPLFLVEAGIQLAGCFDAQNSTAVVTYNSDVALDRELANIKQIQHAHGFEHDALKVEFAANAAPDAETQQKVDEPQKAEGGKAPVAGKASTKKSEAAE